MHLTDSNRGKHFIGDFLPPDELERFMETFRVNFFARSLFSSPEHEALMVSYCDQSMSVVRRVSCVVNNLF